MKKLLFLLISTLSTLPCAIAGLPAAQRTDSASDHVQAIKALEAETLKASLQGDLVALDRLWADDYEFTAPNGLTVPKAAYIGMLKSGAVKYDQFESESLQVRVYGESATVSGRIRVKGQANGHLLDGLDHYLTVYVRRDGKWRSVATLATRVTTFARG